MRTLMDSSAFAQVLIFLALVDILAAAPASSKRTGKGCDEACQKECLEVLNKYRTNHDAPKLQFSQTLADKAQKWADGGKFGYDMDARGKYGQLIEWDVKDELPTFKTVIKHWHDKEKDYDFIKGKSKNGQTLHDFTQVVWKKAQNAGCGLGRMFGSQYYVVWMDADGVISPKFASAENKNVSPPKQRDLHWFEVTKLTAVGEPLFWNNTNSTQPGNCPCNSNTQQQDCCKSSQQKIRTKSSVSEDEEDEGGEENEEQILNESNNIKNYMHASLSKVFAEENKEVKHLRDELEVGDSPSVRMYDPQFSIDNEMSANENFDTEQQENGSPINSIKNMYMNKVDMNEDQESDNDENNGVGNQDRGSSSNTSGSSHETESTPSGAVGAQNTSSDKRGRKIHMLEKITPEAAFSMFAHPNHMAGKRLKYTGKSSQAQLREMTGLIMGKVSEKEVQNNDSDNHLSKEYNNNNNNNYNNNNNNNINNNSNNINSNIINDDNLNPDMKIELSKVSRLINTRIKDLTKKKETSRAQNYGRGVKEEEKEGDPMELKANDEPDARPARITFVGAPLSFPEKNKDKASANDVKDIKNKVKQLWKAHLKVSKEKRKESEQFESDVYQDSGEDSDNMVGKDGSANKKGNRDGSDSVTVEDFNQLHGFQYLGNGHDYNAMNPMNGQAIQQNNGYGINGMQSPGHVHPAMGGEWFGGPMGFSQGFGNPLSPQINMGPGGLYDYRKKFTSEDPEQQSESGSIHNSEGFSGNKHTSVQPANQEDQNTREDEHNSNSEKEPALEPIRSPESPVENKDNDGPFIPHDHHDVLTLPKELQFHEPEDQETSIADNLPDMISENPSISTSSDESDTQPGYFNEDFHGPTYRYQNDQQSKTASPQYQGQPSYNYPTQTPSSTQTPMATPNNQALQDIQMQGSTSSQQHNQLQRLPQGTMYQQSANQALSPQQTMAHNSDYRQRPAPGMQGLEQQPLQDVPEQSQQLLQGDRLPASIKIILNPHQTGYTLLSDKEKSTKNKPSTLNEKDDSKGSSNKDEGNGTNKQSNEGTGSGMISTSQMPQGSTPDSSANGPMMTLNGRPMKPHESSGEYITKGPFVYQTDTTIVMGGPTQSSSKPVNSNSGVHSVPQNATVQQNSKPNETREENKQDKESTKDNKQVPSKLPNGFDHTLLKRPSLITLLKEAQGDNKSEKSKSEKEDNGPSGSEIGEKPKESQESHKTDESNGEKKTEKIEEGKTQNESNSTAKRPEKLDSKEGQEKGSESDSKNEEKSSKEPNESVSSSSDKRPQESTEREKEKEDSQGKEQQSKSPVDEKASGEEKEKGGSPDKQKSSGENKPKEEASSNKESPPEKEKEKKENSIGVEQSEKQESTGPPEKEAPSSSSPVKENSQSGLSEKAEKGSSSSEKENSASESNENAKEESNLSIKEAPPSSSPVKENSQSGLSEKAEKGSSSSEKENSASESNENAKEESSLSIKEAPPSGSTEKKKELLLLPSSNSPGGEKEQGSSSQQVKPLIIPGGKEHGESSSVTEKQENNGMKAPLQSDLVASIRLKQGRIFIEPQQLQTTESASQGGTPGRMDEKAQETTSVQEVPSHSNNIATQNQPSPVQANEQIQSTDNADQSTGETDKVKVVNPKPIVPFDKLLSRINQALGLDSPHSKLKVSGIALASKANSTSPEVQPLQDDIKGNANALSAPTNFKPNIAVDVPEFVANNNRTPQSNFVKLGQFWLNHPSLQGTPMGTGSGSSTFRPRNNNEVSSNLHQHVVNNGRPEGHVRLPVPFYSASLTGVVDDSQSGSPTHRESGSPVVENAQPSITHSSCNDTGERCPLWQQRGYCNNVQYADFMKRHCKLTCGYCAFPNVQIQSERAHDIGNAQNHECKDSQSYEFSCPTWKAQGYCQKKEKEMKLFCRSTCNFCKRKKIKKKGKQHDEQTRQQPLTNSNGDGNFAQAQTGDSTGKNVATAQTGNATIDPQSKASAQGGNTFAQTQSSSTQQTAYAVAYPAPAPHQQTYSHAQSGSLPGRQSSAHASSDDLNKTSTSHPMGPKSLAQVHIGNSHQVSQMNQNPKPLPQGGGHKGFALEDVRDDELALEEKVMKDSPEYQTLDSHDHEQYYVTTGSEEEQHPYDEPVFRFPKISSVAFSKPERNDESTATENSGNLQQDSSETNDDINDVESKEKEDERINSLVARFDSEDDDLKDNSLMSVNRLEKKGAVNSVATKGCDKSCQKECLGTINSYRNNHAAQPLTLNQDLATHAQNWADMKAYGHSAWAQEGLGGELIAVGSFYNTFTAAVKAWHDEEKNVDWSNGKSKGGEIKHFKQLVHKDASLLGCGKTSVNGEPYYIAQMDVATSDNEDDSDKRESIGNPKTPDLGWYLDSSPYWKDLQERGKIPSNVHNRLV